MIGICRDVFQILVKCVGRVKDVNIESVLGCELGLRFEVITTGDGKYPGGGKVEKLGRDEEGTESQEERWEIVFDGCIE